MRPCRLVTLGLVALGLMASQAGAQTFVTQWGSVGSAPGQFYQPSGIAVSPSGDVYVADYYNNRVQKFTAAGTFLTQWAVFYPRGVAVDSSGDVYIASDYGQQVLKFDATGDLLLQWGSSGTGEGQFQNPYALAVDASGNVYVTEFYGSRVQKFTSNGTFLLKWGSLGSGDGQFAYPVGITVDPSGNVFVAEYGSFTADNGSVSYVDRIQKFTGDGAFITKWGMSGCCDGMFDYPSGIAADPFGHVYVTDFYNDRVEEFDSNGGLILKWGSAGTGPGQFVWPSGVAVAPGGTLVYVIDVGIYNTPPEDRVQQFSVADLTAPVTVASLSGPIGTNGFFRGAVQVTLSATDVDDAVAATNVSVNGGPYTSTACCGPMTLTLSSDGVYELSYFSVDTAGNQESPKTLTVKIDQTPPALTLNVTPTVLWPPNGAVVPVYASGTIADSLSGVDTAKAVFAVTDSYGLLHASGALSPANGTFAFTVPLQARRNATDLGDRTYTITVTAQDFAGNRASSSAVVTVPHDQRR